MTRLKPSTRKQCKSNNSRGLFRGSLVIWFISTLFIALWLFYVDDLKPISSEPLVLSKDDLQDIFVRTTGPRVVIFVMSDRIDDTLCYSVGSAYLSGFPVVVAGYQMKYKGFLSKFDFMEKAIQNAQLNPDDVAILMDSDTVFTGADIQAFLDRFIAQSAATPEELDALSVRQGRAMAPIIPSAEAGCWAPNILKGWPECIARFNTIYAKVQRYTAAHPEHKLVSSFGLSSHQYINAGVVIARAWAYNELLQKADYLIKTQPTKYKPRKGWDCDQSVLTALYLDLLAWEVEQDVFSLPLHERQAARSTYGVRAGFMDLDYANMFSAPRSIILMHLTEMYDRHWTRHLPLDKIGHPHSEKIINFKVVARFVSDLYKRAYAAHGEEIYTRLAVPKWVDGKRTSEKIFISLTPPLLATELRSIDEINNEVRRTFPVNYHAAGTETGYTKVGKLEHGAVGAQWFVPMVHNPNIERETMEYLASMPLFLSTHNSIIQDSYDAKCGFPFRRTIKRALSA
ncbi:unnamed protein product [Phytomonas sp. Hart1]|nr:unnamed protein product [Phytomonas sp. Hart1]|eukprot:CCW72220.1 unnamed protein product [Phytomonas sp. isolate Hart1]